MRGGAGGSALYIVDEELRGQIVQFSGTDIASVRDGYRTEGMPEAMEVIGQLMAAPGASDFILLQKGGKRIAGNLAPMRACRGVRTALSRQRRRTSHPGYRRLYRAGCLCISGSDLYRAGRARAHILHTLIWVFARGLVLAGIGGTIVSRNVLRRTDAIASACRAIMDGDLKTRIPVRGTRDELDRCRKPSTRCWTALRA